MLKNTTLIYHIQDLLKDNVNTTSYEDLKALYFVLHDLIKLKLNESLKIDIDILTKTHYLRYEGAFDKWERRTYKTEKEMVERDKHGLL